MARAQVCGRKEGEGISQVSSKHNRISFYIKFHLKLTAYCDRYRMDADRITILYLFVIYQRVLPFPFFWLLIYLLLILPLLLPLLLLQLSFLFVVVCCDISLKRVQRHRIDGSLAPSDTHNLLSNLFITMGRRA